MSRSLIGTRIRERRRTRKVTQAALAEQVGISASYLNLIEHNRRGIAGKTLLSLAKALDLNPRDLTEGADLGLVNRIREVSARNRTIPTEQERLEEFIGRFPGFARLIERLFDQQQAQDQNLQALSDKVSNDPFFAEAIHLMLSNITTIRSTADILKNTANIPEEIASKFLSNLLEESERLSQTASDILNHFEPSNPKLEHINEEYTPDTYLEKNKYYLEALESGKTTPEEIATNIGLNSQDEQILAIKIFEKYQTMAKALPISRFLKEASRLRYNPLQLADQFNADLTTTLERLAHLPDDDHLPKFGIIECDSSGSVLYRKQLQTLSLPKYSSACPLWPLYRSLSQPMQPIRAIFDMPTGERFLSYSIASFTEHGSFNMPGRLKATMLFTQDYQKILGKNTIANLPHLSVGLQCSVCPRNKCEARRSTYILG